MKKCKRGDCNNQFPNDNPDKQYCSDRCRKTASKRKTRKLARENTPVIEALTTITCARYDCDNTFVPKSINHKYCKPACAEIAGKQKQLIDTLNNLDKIDPVEVRAKESFLVRELERQRETLQRLVLKLQSREAAVVSSVEEWLETKNAIRFDLGTSVTSSRAGSGRPTDAHLLFSDPQAGKWENGIGLEVLLNDYIPRVLKSTLAIVEKQRYEGAVDHFYLHLLGDLVEGCTIYPGQRQYLDRNNNGDSVVDQVLTMVDALGAMLAELRPNFKRMTVTSAWGNHGRTAKKDDPSLGHDNYDRMVGLILERVAKNLDIDFVIPEDDRYTINTMGWVLGGIHGHQLNGRMSGLGSMELPLLRWDAVQHFGVPLDVLVLGHRHHAASLDIQGIEVIQNAAMDGGSNWLKNTTGTSAKPSQEFFFVSEKYGIDSRHRIYLGERQPRIKSLSKRIKAFN